MTKAELLRLLEKTLMLPPHSLTGHEKLKNIYTWDSMGSLEFITMADSKCGLTLLASQVAQCQTVEDLLGLLGNTSPLAA